MDTNDDKKARVATLTMEEDAVFRRAASGYNCLEIARRLALGRTETLMLLLRVLLKLGVRDRRGLILEYRAFADREEEL